MCLPESKWKPGEGGDEEGAQCYVALLVHRVRNDDEGGEGCHRTATMEIITIHIATIEEMRERSLRTLK